MADKISYGWTGKLVRVNLSSDTISIEDDSHLQDGYIGGMGFANKILYDEVPAGVDWKDEEAKIVLAAGPLTGSGVPLAGRSTWSHLSTFTTDHLVVDSHNGGMIGAALKYSGHDAIIIEGAADTPVYILIDDDTISIEDASDVWAAARARRPRSSAASTAPISAPPSSGQPARTCCPIPSSSTPARTRPARGQAHASASKNARAWSSAVPRPCMSPIRRWWPTCPTT